MAAGQPGAAEVAASTGEGRPLPLLASLKKEWCKGHLSAKQVQEFAMGAEAQGAYGMTATASAGTRGKNPQNIHRTLASLFGTPKGCPSMTWSEVPTKSGKFMHPFFLPHMSFASLAAECPELFQSAMLGPEGGCSAFWTMMHDTPFVREHPVLAPDNKHKTIPLGFYGDGGAFSHQDSLLVFTYNSLLGTGRTMSKRYVITCVKKSDIIPGTLESIFKIIGWSFNVLVTGLWPEEDWMKRPLDQHGYLANGLRGCLSQVRGDWEFYTSIFGFPKWNEAKNMCWMCGASAAGPMTFADCSPAALWRATKRSHESYVAELDAKGKELPALFRHTIGLRLETIMVDVLHTCDLGFGAHLIGNVFNECILAKVWSTGPMADNIAGLNAALKVWYIENQTTSLLKGDLTMDRIRSRQNNWPKIKAKAAATRHLAPFALHLARAHLADRRIQALCQMLCEFYQMMERQGMFLDEEAKERMPRLGQRMCGLYAQLAATSLAAGHKRWKMTPKVHLLLHLCEWQGPSVGNPRFFWVYSDEDLVGSMIEVAESCHAKTMAATALMKWSILVFDPDVRELL